MSARVVVTGSGVLSCLGDSPKALHTALVAGQSGLGPIDQFAAHGQGTVYGAPIHGFAPEYHLDERHLKPPISPMPRVVQLSAAVLQGVLAPPELAVEVRQEWAIGLVLGTMFCSVGAIAGFDRQDRKKPLEFANTVINAAAGKAAICHKLTGINSTISTGLTSGLNAIAYAAASIRSGQATALLAGGAEELSFESLHGFTQVGLTCGTSEGEAPFPVPFDIRRNGFAPGEGAAFLLLEEAEAAKARGARVLAEITGQGSTYDTSGGKDAARAVEAISSAMQLALADAGIDAGDIGCVSASANGSVHHDRWEAQALEETVGSQVPITAIKSMVGEALGAGGAMQAVSMIETLQTGMIPGIVGCEQLEEGFDLQILSPQCQDLDLTCGMINAVGYDGHCSSLIVSRPAEG